MFNHKRSDITWYSHPEVHLHPSYSLHPFATPVFFETPAYTVWRKSSQNQLDLFNSVGTLHPNM